jgi:hypothetical protein
MDMICQSPTGKRLAKYFKYKTGEHGAEQFIKDHEAQRREHGNSTVTAEERHWINIARAKLGNLAKLGEVLEHWRKTGANINYGVAIVRLPAGSIICRFCARSRARSGLVPWTS